MFRFAILTFGCRVNQADSFDCEREFRAAGGVSASADDADLVVVNTCSVTGAADQAARRAIRRVARRNPRARIVATGCYATRSPGDLESLPAVVAVLPNHQKDQLLSSLAHVGQGSGLADVGQRSSLAAPSFHPGDRGRTAFPLRVQTGCDETCSYCAIPPTRGPSRSRPLAEAIDEAGRLAAAGYLEVILTGVHLGAYGRDLDPPASLLALLRGLGRLPGSFRVRVSSLEPMDCPPEVLELVAGSPRFAPHFHFPLQHASDRLLALMRRPYRLSDYRALVDLARAALPHAAIGCDVIVGFPGETEADHQVLVDYLSASPITHLHVFPYSDRPGTAAAAMQGKVGPSEVAARCAGLRAVSGRLQAAFAQGQVGRVRDAVTIEDGSRAVTDNYLKVAIPVGHSRNERVRVRIASAQPLRGEVVA